MNVEESTNSMSTDRWAGKVFGTQAFCFTFLHIEIEWILSVDGISFCMLDRTLATPWFHR